MSPINMRIRLALSLVAISASALLFQNCSSSFSTTDPGTPAPSSSFRLQNLDASNADLLRSVGNADQQVEILKRRGCMFDGLIYPGGLDFDDNLQVLKRSECVYLQRVIETWADPPQFQIASENMRKIKNVTQKDFIFGMFIAEALDITKNYTDENGTPFNFAVMCHPNSMGVWEDPSANPKVTCLPNSAHPEYQRYLRYIIGKAMDIGIRDILFGQLGLIDPTKTLTQLLPEFRAMAQARGITVAFGGQPNGIMPAAYLHQFDYIVTPSYIDVDKSEKCVKGTNCQAIYFHPELAGLGKAVIAEVDWYSGDDDAHRMGKKNPQERRRYIYEHAMELKRRNIGFVLPFRIWYNGGGSLGACEGINTYVYSASNSYQCKDEDFWNKILIGKNPFAQTPVEGAALTAIYLATITEIYKAVLKREPDIAGLQYYLTQFIAGTMTAEYLRAHFTSMCVTGAELCGRATVVPKKTCMFNGQNVAHGNQVLAYMNAVAPNGTTCTSELRTCLDGALSGTYSHLTCKVAAPVVLTDSEYMTYLYLEIFKRNPDTGGLDYFVNELKLGRMTRDQIRLYFYGVCNRGEEQCGR